MSVIVGLTMALFAVGSALGIALTFPLSLFPELAVNCQLVELNEAALSMVIVPFVRSRRNPLMP